MSGIFFWGSITKLTQESSSELATINDNRLLLNARTYNGRIYVRYKFNRDSLSIGNTLTRLFSYDFHWFNAQVDKVKKKLLKI